MSERKRKSKLLDALHSIINEARLAIAHPNSQPAITQKMLSRPFLKKIHGTRGLRMHLIAAGLGDEIRRYLKRGDEETDSATVDQLQLWPTRLQAIVKDIDRARVFVPSRGEFVLLAPDDITSTEAREAGEYLIAKGQDCIRVGNQLIRLSRQM